MSLQVQYGMTLEVCREKLQFLIIAAQIALQKVLNIDTEGVITAICLASESERRTLQDDTVT